ncbi:MAG TPA: DedA family protein [Gemmatimonadaceae bacterium]|nr:DedA family protein [Gemmatimonadaceae bacterium]
MRVEQLFDWLTGLPPIALYVALAITAAIENFFPPVPADTVVAFGSFLAARGEATVFGAFLSTWIGNVGGAMAVYALGRKYGTAWLEKRLSRFGGPGREKRLEALYARWGLGAIFLSRFLPGVRAIVPPFAGAFGVRPVPVALAIGIASALWYGLVTYLAYRVGADWETLTQSIGSLTTYAAMIAGAVAAFAFVVWLVRRKRGRAGGIE